MDCQMVPWVSVQLRASYNKLRTSVLVIWLYSSFEIILKLLYN